MASAGQGPADELVCSGYQAQRRTDLGRYRAPGCTRRAGAVPTRRGWAWPRAQSARMHGPYNGPLGRAGRAVLSRINAALPG